MAIESCIPKTGTLGIDGGYESTIFPVSSSSSAESLVFEAHGENEENEEIVFVDDEIEGDPEKIALKPAAKANSTVVEEKAMVETPKGT
jgi:hypothetical protein